MAPSKIQTRPTIELQHRRPSDSSLIISDSDEDDLDKIPALLQAWDTVENAAVALKAWHLDKGLSYKCKMDPMRILMKCRQTPAQRAYGAPACTFAVRCAPQKALDGAFQLTRYREHTCLPVVHEGWSEFNTGWYVEFKHGNYLDRKGQVRAKELCAIVGEYGHTTVLPTMQAWRAIQLHEKKKHGNEDDSFSKFPAYEQALKEADSDTFAHLKCNLDTSRFQSFFVAPGPMRKAFKHLRTFLSMDATHTRSKYRMVLAITVGIDANGETTPLCWGLMPGEDRDY